MSKVTEISARLLQHATKPKDRKVTFFKTGPGDYGAHDQFLGIPVPTLRKIAREYKTLSYEDLAAVLSSVYNEERLFALIVLVHRYETREDQEKVYKFYLTHKAQVNNWNLVDASAHLILGAYLFDKDKSPLLKLAESPVIWDRRIAMVSTWYFIRQDKLEWTFKIAQILLNDKEDLIHKAVGWMLREAGKRDEARLRLFLEKYAPNMPRTMLRYAIEKFDEPLRKQYLAK